MDQTGVETLHHRRGQVRDSWIFPVTLAMNDFWLARFLKWGGNALEFRDMIKTLCERVGLIKYVLGRDQHQTFFTKSAGYLSMVAGDLRGNSYFVGCPVFCAADD
ncbi:hypothetical protein [Lentilactobacillus parafarraginis]|nr:hypothetical protein [Lentilactobacillus parafarraginis]